MTTKPTDNISTDPSVVAKARELGDQIRAGIDPAAATVAPSFDAEALIRETYLQYMSSEARDGLSVDEWTKRLMAETGECTGTKGATIIAFTEGEFRMFLQSMCLEWNAVITREKAEQEHKRAKHVREAFLYAIQDRHGRKLPDHWHVDPGHAIMRECTAPADPLAALLEKLGAKAIKLG